MAGPTKIVVSPTRNPDVLTVVSDSGEDVVDVAVFSIERANHNMPGVNQNALAMECYLRRLEKTVGRDKVKIVSFQSNVGPDHVYHHLQSHDSTQGYVPLSAGGYETLVRVSKERMIGALESLLPNIRELFS